ncbi:hydroxyacylglutathione hydrolase [Dongia mobilis]|uniref:Hydroxyacylglutathione hydrolase n=1 Tax=Dongia mobilis TaxID=578943 RepID=A0A4V3DF23_9PROT|nr:hydroxyacylglutathione hydrolase [Dongia mobilis]TDQ83400.1 hydroxyacylglutathione hydrolase [Dongia mobilis]
MAPKPAPLDIVVFPMLSDNYGFLLHDAASGETAVVDPAEAEPTLSACAQRGWRLSHILNTHHHGDHVGGNLALKAATGCKVVGPAYDRDRIPGIDIAVDEASGADFGGRHARVFFVPGHTRGHIAYWFAEDKALFCGDTLFALGCGRLFEGTPQQMWSSLIKLRALPDDTRVYCAHEYTQSNARFALTAEPDNAALQAEAARVAQLRAVGSFTIPSQLGVEKACNPFLRADQPALRRRFGSAGCSDAEVLGAIRAAKDRF